MAYSDDLKQRVLAFVAAGGSKAEAAQRFSVARSTVFVWLAQPPGHRRGKPGPKGGRTIDRAQLARLIEAQPGLSQRALAQRLGVSANGISRALMAMRATSGRTGRKRPSTSTRSSSN